MFYFICPPRRRYLGYRWRLYRIITWTVGACPGKLLVLESKVGMLQVVPSFLPLYDAVQSSRSFLVDACMRLTAHIDTEGLFRKSGSVVRLKALKVRDPKISTRPSRLLELENSYRLQTPFVERLGQTGRRRGVPVHRAAL